MLTNHYSSFLKNPDDSSILIHFSCNHAIIWKSWYRLILQNIPINIRTKVPYLILFVRLHLS